MSWHDPDHDAAQDSGVLTPDFTTTAYPIHANHVPFSLVASRGEDVTVPFSPDAGAQVQVWEYGKLTDVEWVRA